MSNGNGISVTAPEERVIVVRPSASTVPIIAPTQQRMNISIPTGPPGKEGPPGKDALWESMTQAEYDALSLKDPQTLYVIVP
jgi:hypothetical protein